MRVLVVGALGGGMENEDSRVWKAAEMRRRAEQIYLEKAPQLPENPAALPPDDLKRILHELRVHQIELELWNEELRRVQEELAGERTHYFDLYELAPVGYCIIGKTGLILDANLTTATMLGLTRGALVNRPFSRIILHEDQTLYFSRRKQLSETGRQDTIELRLVKKDGTVFWARLDATAARDADGMPVCRIVITDITECHMAKASLCDSEARLRALFENAPCAVFIADTETEKILDVNEEAEILTGRTRLELIGMDRLLLHPRAEAEYYKQHFKDHVASGCFRKTSDAVIEKKDGTCVPVQISGAVLEVGGRNIIQGMFEDISERKRLEAALVASKIQLVEMTTRIPVVIFQFYSRANGEMGLYFVSASSEPVIGLKPDLDGYFERFLALIIPEYRESFIASIEKAVKTRSKWNYTGMLQKPSGEKIWFYGDSSPLQPGVSNEVVFNGTMSDITLHKLAEQALRAHSEMKSKFASMVSHELRSPLTAIMLGISHIKGDTAALSAEHKRMFELINNNAARLGRLINSVLDFQKMSAGKMPFYIHENDITDLVKATMLSMAPLAKNKGLTLTPNLVPGLPRARFDKDKITQVLTNLLSNAIEHSQEGGVTVSAGCEGDSLHVSVRDTGHGIKAEDLPKLFQAFEQLEYNGIRKAGGTGLGLAISKEIILAHNGHIWAESEPGKGSIFHFTLPIAQEGTDDGKKNPIC